MSPRIIIYLVIIVIVVAAGFFIYSLFFANNAGTNPGAGQVPPAINASSTPANFPTGNTVTIGTSQGSVTVNNFYKNPVLVTPDNEIVIFKSTSSYNIAYYVPDGTFSIALLSEPIDAARAAAESAFVQAVGVSKTDACKLNVYEGVPADVNPAYAGRNLGLSFCQKAIQ